MGAVEEVWEGCHGRAKFEEMGLGDWGWVQIGVGVGVEIGPTLAAAIVIW